MCSIPLFKASSYHIFLKVPFFPAANASNPHTANLPPGAQRRVLVCRKKTMIKTEQTVRQQPRTHNDINHFGFVPREDV